MTPFTPPAAPAGPSTAKVLVAVGVSMALIVILGVVAALVLGTASRERFEAVGTASPWVGGPQPWSFPAAQDEGPTLGDTWQAAYGVYVCDEFIAPFDGPSPMGFGIDTAGDGIIDIEPVNDTVTLYDATMKVFGDQVGMRWRPGGLELPDGTVVTDCDGRPVDVVVFRWQQARPDQLTPEVEYGPLSNVMFRRDGEVFTIAVVPAGTAEDLAWERRDRLMPPSVDLLKAGGARVSSGTAVTAGREPDEVLSELVDQYGYNFTFDGSNQVRPQALSTALGVSVIDGYRGGYVLQAAETELLPGGDPGQRFRFAVWRMSEDTSLYAWTTSVVDRPLLQLDGYDAYRDQIAAFHWTDNEGMDRTSVIAQANGLWVAAIFSKYLEAEELLDTIMALERATELADR